MFCLRCCGMGVLMSLVCWLGLDENYRSTPGLTRGQQDADSSLELGFTRAKTLHPVNANALDITTR